LALGGDYVCFHFEFSSLLKYENREGYC